jgi:hypothetical protein
MDMAPKYILEQVMTRLRANTIVNIDTWFVYLKFV